MQERGIDRCRTRVKEGLALVLGLGLSDNAGAEGLMSRRNGGLINAGAEGLINAGRPSVVCELVRGKLIL